MELLYNTASPIFDEATNGNYFLHFRSLLRKTGNSLLNRIYYRTQNTCRTPQTLLRCCEYVKNINPSYSCKHPKTEDIDILSNTMTINRYFNTYIRTTFLNNNCNFQPMGRCRCDPLLDRAGCFGWLQNIRYLSQK